MDLDDQMEIYKKRTVIMPDEDKIRRTVEVSMESFLQTESEKILSYNSFLRIQFGLIRKRWWVLQAGVLALVWAALLPAQHNPYIYRSLGLAAALFVILMIPELWKNRVNCCMEIEAMTVTACICFGILGSRDQVSESAALGLCILWSALWWYILMDEKLYRALSVPVWMILLGMALLFLAVTVCRSIRRCDDIWEVDKDGTENE